METKNQILKIPPFNFLHFSDSMVSFSSKSESYKFSTSKQILAIFQILAMGYGTFRSIIEANSCNMVVPPIMPTCFGQKMGIFPESTCVVISPHVNWKAKFEITFSFHSNFYFFCGQIRVYFIFGAFASHNLVERSNFIVEVSITCYY